MKEAIERVEAGTAQAREAAQTLTALLAGEDSVVSDYQQDQRAWETKRRRMEQEITALRAEVAGRGGAGTSNAQARVAELEREKNEFLQQVVDTWFLLMIFRCSALFTDITI
ncbi:MAG: hypothetical protein Crog4KO_36360 [Crocinitomicaceae bacterium]